MAEELIFESRKSKIFYVENEEIGKSAALKLLNIEFPSQPEISQFYNESAVIEGVDIEGIRKVISTTKSKNRHALVLEWFDGQPFHEAFKNKKEDIIDFLYVAIEVTGTLAELHQQGIIHKDINPGNILIRLQDRKIKLIDFEISSRIQGKSLHLLHPRHLPGTLEYCSPEQTGRMNRTVDSRSDLYSLGATFYAILAGQPPFQSKDAMELVHAHIAQRPKRLGEVNPAVPGALSDVIGILLEKNPEHRYQSAVGLKHDLQCCLRHVQDAAPAFALREQDFSSTFQVSQKLYGRDREIDTILKKFDECAAGRVELLLIAGYSGTGKTSLVHEVHRPITLRKGYYSEWKFDQFNKSTPYSAFLHVFSSLIETLLSEEKETLEQIASDIRQAVGDEGKVLTDLLPNLELLIGTQPPVPDLGGEEASRRLTYLIQKFFAVLCTSQHPIVFFIDDLQWADAASLHLLRKLLTLPNGGHFLCIGAYRDNEVKEGHPLLAAITSIEAEGVEIETITLTNLQQSDIRQMLCDSLHRNDGDPAVKELSELVMRKTVGNAFFTVQFLKSLAENNLVRYDQSARSWQWDTDQIHTQNITDNVVALMAGKVQKLPPDSQQLLMYMSCLGNTSMIHLLALISGKESDELLASLFPALQEGLIFTVHDVKLKFAHDKIQQAVYAMVDNREREEIHFRVGRLLEDQAQLGQSDEQIFDVVNHYNAAAQIFEKAPEDQRYHLAKLNHRATLRAKRNSAFDIALDYLIRTKELLRVDSWQHDYDFAFAVYRELLEVSYLCARYDLTDQFFTEIDRNAKTPVDRVKAYEVRINMFKAKNDLPAAIDAGLEALSILGKPLPANPNPVQVLWAIAKTEFRLRNVTQDTIDALPEMEDPADIEAMHVMTHISPSAYWAKPNLIPLIAHDMIKLTLNQGVNILSGWCFAGYGIILCGVLGAMRKGYRYGQFGLHIQDRYHTKEWRTQVEDPVYALIVHWNKHVEHSLIPLRNSFYTGLETGENEFACVNANIYCIHSFLCGRPLPNLNKETQAFSQTFQSLKQETQLNYNEVYRQAMLCFMGESSAPHSLEGAAYNSSKMEAVHAERKDRTGLFFIYFLKGMLAYYFERHEESFHLLEKAYRLKDAILSKFEIPNLYFYRALVAIALMDREVQGISKTSLFIIFNRSLAALSYYARYAPENYRHKCTIIKSQWAVYKNRFSRAQLLFDQAVSQANDHRYLHEEALAYELAGKAYHQRGYADLAKYYLSNALSLYNQWGAKAKADQLVAAFPKYFTAVRGNSPTEASTNGDWTVNSSSLDMSTLLKASMSISSEVELPNLITNLMKVVVENAGAQKGVLILEENEALWVEAVYDIDARHHELLQHTPLDQHQGVPISVVHFMHRAKKVVESHSFDTLKEFTQDVYLQSKKPESMLGLPIVDQGKFVGALYLENAVAKNVFTRERVALLSMLSSQIAVSIDNALLYQNLERKVADRTQELESEKQKTDSLLFNILPREVAEELKHTGKTQPQYFEAVTILFTDFVGFTYAARDMTAEQLVTTVDYYFQEFDKIVKANRLEKIKTIGDAYMCSGGLPVPNSTHAFDAVKAALAMIEFTEETKARNKSLGLPELDLRIGIHTGPIVAGVVGINKFAYDIWGNAVNKASRLESSGQAGQVNISEETYQIVKHAYDCEFRGKVQAKNIGEINMYFVREKRGA